MDSSDAIRVLMLIILLCLSAFFSSAETALTTVNKLKIRSLADSGSKRAIKLMKVIDNPTRMLSAILIGNNVVNLSASALTTVITLNLFGNTGVGIGTGILTLAILVLGEISPKTIATIHAESLALKYAGCICFLTYILTPVIFVTNKMSLAFLFLLHIDPNKKNDGITEDELRTIVEVSHEEGVIESEEKKMINNVFDFGDSVAKDIMVPRIDMVFASVDATYEELIDIFRREKYTRIPVYEDTTDNVIGIINMKDLLLPEEKDHFSIRRLLRQPLYTYEYKKTAELMLEMRKTFNNIVIVLDEYGATAGLITLEDMLEEIVGDIRDEYDEDEEESLVQIGPGEYMVDGSMKLDDLNEELGLSLESEDYDSLGGLIIGLLDHLPEEGEAVEHNGLRLVVERVDKNRIDKVHLFTPILKMKEEETVPEDSPSGGV